VAVVADAADTAAEGVVVADVETVTDPNFDKARIVWRLN
jgi:hypothetical protein